MTETPRRRVDKRLLLVVALVVVMNLPTLASWWTERRLDGEGRSVQTPAAVGADPGSRLVEVRLPEALLEEPDAGDPGGPAGLAVMTVRLEEAAYDQVAASGEATVTYLPEEPTTYRVEGADRRLGLVAVLVGNAVLLLVIGLFLLLRGRTRPELRMVATADLRRTAPQALLERLEGNDYLVRGEVDEVGAEEVLLVVGDRRVRVDLAGHANPAGPRQGVEVRGTMVG